MGKVIGAVVGAVVSIGEIVGGAVTGNPFLIAAGAIGLASVAASTLFPTNTATQNRLSKSVDVNAYRKIAFGNTVLGADIRYWEVHGQTGYTEVLAAAGHKINSIGNLYVNSKLVNFSTSVDGAVGLCTGTSNYSTQNDGSLLTENDNTYKGDWRRTFISAGTEKNAQNIASQTLWTSSKGMFMTGIAYYINDYTFTQSNFPQGIPQVGTQVGEGALVYDPRRDPTYGGTGSHNINDQTTWQYSPTDSNGVPIGRNNALQMLFYLLGWRVADPNNAAAVTLTVGQGVSPTDINIASFIAAANNCEIEQWYSDGLLSTGDSHTSNRQIIAAAAGGDISDPGGLWTYNVAGDDTANIAVTLTEDDIVSAVNYNAATSINSKYNQIGGSYVESAPPIFYQPQPYALVSDPNYIAQDQGQKLRKNVDFQFVQNTTQAQKLARIILNKNRLTATFKATFTLKALQALYYNCVRLNYAPLGISNGLFRVTGQAINPMGGIDLTLTIENATAYGGGTIIGAPPPSAGVGYNAFADVDMSGFGAEPTVGVGNATSAVDSVVAYWTPPPANVAYAEVQWSLYTDQVNWTPAGRVLPTDNINATTNQQSINVGTLQPNTQYAVRGRFVTISAVPGDWSLTNVLTGSGTMVVAFDTTHIGGVPTANIIAQFNSNATASAQTILQGAALTAFINTQTTLNGQWIGTVVTNNAYTASTATSAVATNLGLIGAKAGNNQGFIINSSTVSVTLSNGSSTTFDQINTTLNGHTTSITELNQSYTNLDGTVSAQSTNSLNVNGYISGTQSINNGSTSQYYILTSVFGLIDPTSGNSYFSEAGGVVRMSNVMVDLLDVNTVTTANIIAFAVTKATEYDDTTSQSLGSINSAAVQVCAVTATTMGHPMQLLLDVALNNGDGSHDQNLAFTLYDSVNGGTPSLIKTYYGRLGQNSSSIQGGAKQDFPTFFRYSTGAALTVGTHAFTLFAQLIGGTSGQTTKYFASISVTEFKDQTS